jgi:hypothetical protein
MKSLNAAGLPYRKSTRSGVGNCVETGIQVDRVGIFDSKSVVTFAVPRDTFTDFLNAAKNGAFGRP